MRKGNKADHLAAIQKALGSVYMDKKGHASNIKQSCTNVSR